jgi:hypothetical protein
MCLLLADFLKSGTALSLLLKLKNKFEHLPPKTVMILSSTLTEEIQLEYRYLCFSSSVSGVHSCAKQIPPQTTKILQVYHSLAIKIPKWFAQHYNTTCRELLQGHAKNLYQRSLDFQQSEGEHILVEMIFILN